VFGKGYAHEFALGQAQCAWYGHWVAAARAGDDAAVARSYAEALQLRRMMPLHRAGQLEDAGGYTRGSLVATDREIAAAHRGDFALVREFLRANC
jgi:ketosteroid isomerase-like protein